MSETKTEFATLAAGCFWCVEAVFQQLNGVLKVQSGYMGGTTQNPTYKEICTGTTGHAEVIHIEYNPAQVRFEQLLQVFFATHDSTTLNRQGADVGTQYRSAIMTHSEQQQKVAAAVKQELNEQNVFGKPVVTEIVPATEFYPAENYHQNYYQDNSEQQYCQYVIRPKLEKFEQVFASLIKPKS